MSTACSGMFASLKGCTLAATTLLREVTTYTWRAWAGASGSPGISITSVAAASTG